MNDLSPARMRDTSATDVAIDPGPARLRRRLLAGAAVAVLAIGAVAVLPGVLRWLDAEVTVSRERLRTAEVVRGDFVRDVGVDGRVIAAVSPTLYASAAGTVALAVQPGDRVTVGQVLATLDSPEVEAEYQQEESGLQRLAAELERQRIQARKTLAENQQQIDLAEVTLKAAQREMRRAEISYSNHSISEADYERYKDDLARAEVEFRHAGQDAELERDSLEFEVRTRELALERQQLLVDNLARRVERLTVTSPVDGVVGSVVVEDQAAVPANQALMTVVDLTAFEVEVSIPETYADDLGLGMPAEIRYGGDTYAGVLSALSPQVVDNEVVGRVRFEGHPPDRLRQNQRVQARILIDHLRDVLKLRRGPFIDAGGGRIAYVIRDGVATRTPIRLGARSIAEVQVLDGLTEGETVILSSTAEFGEAETLHIVD